MSLIFEALRKLERDKQTPERGLLVVPHAPWPSERRRLLPLAALATAVFGALGLGWWWRGAAPPAAPEPARASLVPQQPGRTRAIAAAVPETALEVGAPTERLPIREAEPSAAAPSASPPAPVGTTPAASLRLQAVSVRDGRPIAMLNDRLVREGDVIDGVRVLRIGETEVEIEVDGRRELLSF